MISIQSSPRLWPLQLAGTQRYLMHQFPYQIVYLNQSDRIWIIAVAHSNREPFYWKERIV